jgi:HD superfamily phosphohydrolase
MIDLDKRDKNAIDKLNELYGDSISSLLNCRIIKRLKGISYLGVTASLYKKIDSSRFSHSINVAILANLMAEKLNLSQDDKNILVLYYLFHDIGHLPNSHVSEPLLRLLQAKRKFHESFGLYSFEDEETKNWFIKNISNGVIVRKKIKDIFSNQFSEINPIISEIIKSPLNPDTIEGIFRTACILEIDYILPENIVSGMYMDGNNILYSNENFQQVFNFFKLQKNIYENYVFSLANQSAEAMWKKALFILIKEQDMNDIDDIFSLTDEMLIEQMLSIPTSKELIENIQRGICLTPYWSNRHPNLMSNKYAEISNSIYSDNSAIDSIENKIYINVFELSKSKFLAMHFSRLRQFELIKTEPDLQLSLFDNLFSNVRDVVSIKKTQGIIPLSVFSYPFIPMEKMDNIDFSSSQKIIDDILINSLSLYKAIVVTPPFSPNDTNLPAGPLVLKSYAKSHNIDIALANLNIKFLNEFNGDNYEFTLGDHCKSNKVEKAYEFFKKAMVYPTISREYEINCMDITKSFPFSFDQINKIVENTLDSSVFWKNFLNKNFFDIYERVPIVGFSIMGTSQLIVSMILSKLIKEYWENTIVIVGGSHITLKRKQIQTEKRYSDYFDFFLPFHSEYTFLECLSGKDIRKIKGIIIPGELTDFYEEKIANTSFPYLIENKDIVDYNKEKCTVPIQLGEGCKKGNCAMCTYNYVEQYKEINFEQKLNILLSNQESWNVHQLSFKDSNLYKNDLLLIASVLNNLDFKWNATTHVDKSMTTDDFKKLSDSGCDNLEVGIESIHIHVQNMIGKTYPIEDIEKYIENGIRANISFVINLIFGFPNETKEDAFKQLEWFEKLKNIYGEKVYGSFNMLEVNYGSAMSQCPSKYGIILGELQPWAFSYPWNAPSWRKEFEIFIKRRCETEELLS